MGQAKPPRWAHLKCPTLSWVSDLPDSGESETNFEFDFYENLVTEAIRVSAMKCTIAYNVHQRYRTPTPLLSKLTMVFVTS